MSDVIRSVNRLVPGLVEIGQNNQATPQPAKVSGEGEFGKLFSDMINSVNELHMESGQAKEAFLAGEPIELHEVMIKAEKAGIATDLLLEIRNKLISGYNEIMRMPM